VGSQLCKRLRTCYIRTPGHKRFHEPGIVLHSLQIAAMTGARGHGRRVRLQPNPNALNSNRCGSITSHENGPVKLGKEGLIVGSGGIRRYHIILVVTMIARTLPCILHGAWTSILCPLRSASCTQSIRKVHLRHPPTRLQALLSRLTRATTIVEVKDVPFARGRRFAKQGERAVIPAGTHRTVTLSLRLL
jgi:hypothetical protein